MSDWTSFTDKEISLIKSKLNDPFEKGMKFSFFILPIFCLVIPYLPGRKGRRPMVETMDYFDAVLQVALILILGMIAAWVINYFKVEKQFSENRKFLRKKELNATILKKKKSIFKSFENILITNLEGDLETISIDKTQTKSFDIGDRIQLEIEENTNTIFKLEKLKFHNRKNKEIE